MGKKIRMVPMSKDVEGEIIRLACHLYTVEVGEAKRCLHDRCVLSAVHHMGIARRAEAVLAWWQECSYENVRVGKDGRPVNLYGWR